MPDPDNHPDPDIRTLAFVGFGEAGMAFATGLGGGQREIRAYDVKTGMGPGLRRQKLREYQLAGVAGCESAPECVAGAHVVFSLVTSDQAVAAAQAAATGITTDSYYLDCNSCAPDSKRAAAAIVDAVGGRYVDVAVMGPVQPKLHETPVLVSGDWAGDALAVMTGLGMCATVVVGGVGAAASVKLIRSVMVKGLEALVAECVLAGARAGVADIVLQSLEKSYPGFDWQGRSTYMLGRMMQHGTRRSAEMDEAARCVDQLGLRNNMSRATSDWQQAIGALSLEPGDKSTQQLADAILAALEQQNRSEN